MIAVPLAQLHSLEDVRLMGIVAELIPQESP